jgi:hypothetical protein
MIIKIKRGLRRSKREKHPPKKFKDFILTIRRESSRRESSRREENINLRKVNNIEDTTTIDNEEPDINNVDFLLCNNISYEKIFENLLIL